VEVVPRHHLHGGGGSKRPQALQSVSARSGVGPVAEDRSSVSGSSLASSRAESPVASVADPRVVVTLRQVDPTGIDPSVSVRPPSEAAKTVAPVPVRASVAVPAALPVPPSLQPGSRSSSAGNVAAGPKLRASSSGSSPSRGTGTPPLTAVERQESLDTLSGAAVGGGGDGANFVV
jgi:hypothetical protein